MFILFTITLINKCAIFYLNEKLQQQEIGKKGFQAEF